MNEKNLYSVRNIELVPVLHGKMEFAAEVRRRFDMIKPDVVAVELPPFLTGALSAALARLPLLSVAEVEFSTGRSLFLVEPTDPFVEALRLADRAGLPTKFVDLATDNFRPSYESFPDPSVIERIGYDQYCSAYYRTVIEPGVVGDDADLLRERMMAYNLGQIDPEKKVLFVFGISHWGSMIELLASDAAQPMVREEKPKVMLHHLGKKASQNVLSEAPYLASAYEQSRAGKDFPPDRKQVNSRLIDLAAENYKKETALDFSPRYKRILFQYARNYALLEGSFTPDLWHLMIAARGVADDNFAWELYQLGADYQYQTDQPRLPVIEPTLEDFYKSSRLIRFHKKLVYNRKTLRLVSGRPEKDSEAWKKLWDGSSMCSFPPEDFVIDSFGSMMKKKSKGLIAEGISRVEPFSSSFLDGVDIRQTLRNWHEQKIYVHEDRRGSIDAGAVILIFDYDDGPAEKYPYTMTWLGEPHDESDLAFYSTSPGDYMIGPGISRCEYGGVLLSYPTLRLWDVWKDPLFSNAKTKADTLLMAGIVYSLQRMVVYSAPRPPTPRLYDFASRFGRKLVYIPLASLDPQRISKIRNFHILDGHYVRTWAREYIF